MKKTNCNYLVYAPESGSPDTLTTIKKRIELDRLTESVLEAKRQGIVVRPWVYEALAIAMEMNGDGTPEEIQNIQKKLEQEKVGKGAAYKPPPGVVLPKQ